MAFAPKCQSVLGIDATEKLVVHARGTDHGNPGYVRQR
jgi:hypothetical protein